MSIEESLRSDEDESMVREAVYIMIVWTLIVVLAGVVLVVLRDPLASILALSGLGF